MRLHVKNQNVYNKQYIFLILLPNTVSIKCEVEFK